MMTRTRLWLLPGLLGALACSDADPAGPGGLQGVGGGRGDSAYDAQYVEQTCREWCVNVDRGFSCFVGPADSVNQCFEDCLAFHQRHTALRCGDEWVDVRSCELDLDCDDSFGDCDSYFRALSDCNELAEERAFCEINCPDLDPYDCARDSSRCRADTHCASACPTQDREQCIQQYAATGACGYAEATDACRRYCSGQGLAQCVEQWLDSSGCDFDDAETACEVFCPDVGAEKTYCVEYLQTHGVCPDSPPLCLPQARTCADRTIVEPPACCAPPLIPDQTDACNGDENLVNPTSCTTAGATVTHRVLTMALAMRCHTGFDLDECDGFSCMPGGLAPLDGIDAVDNGLRGMQVALANLGSELGSVNKAFSDALCGVGDDCVREVPPLSLSFAIDVNHAERCANVTVRAVGICNDASSNVGDPCTSDDACTNGACAGGGVSNVILNIGAPVGSEAAVCMSGTLGPIPFLLGGVPGSFGSAVIRASLTDAAFTHGLLGATLDLGTAQVIAEQVLEGAGAVASVFLDIRSDRTRDTSIACDALSATMEVSGVAVAP